MDAPDLDPTDEFYLKAFNELNTCRVGAYIPWDKIIEYAHVKGLDPEMVDFFIDVIRIMDTAYIKWADKEQQASG